MNTERGRLVVPALMSMFLEKHAGEGIAFLEFSLLDHYGEDTLRMLPWGDARILDQHYFHTGGTYLRAHHAWPQAGDVLYVAGRRMRVYACGLFTFGAAVDAIDFESSSSDSDREEDVGDRL
jgi:hypothetical protein